MIRKVKFEEETLRLIVSAAMYHGVVMETLTVELVKEYSRVR